MQKKHAKNLLQTAILSVANGFFLFFTNILESGDLPVAGIVLSDGTVIGAEHFEELPSIGYAMQMFSVHNYTTLITEVYQYFA